MTTEAYYLEKLAGLYGGKRWILAMPVLAAMSGVVDQLGRLGARKCLCIGATRGTGLLPDEQLAPDPIVLGVGGDDMMDSIRAGMRALADVPPEVRARVDDFAANEDARIIGPIFDDGTPVAGRSKYGARPEAWQRLEDKTRIDAFWDEVGIERTAFRVVAADEASLKAASAEVASDDGHVWVGDNREGFHGGASYLRVVRSDDDARRAADFFAKHCDKVRVMPFLEGIPCSIHGIVFDDYVVSLRPCEMLVFRKPKTMRLHYGKAASFWDPPADDRRQMRQTAKRVGEHLRASVGYRGVFTVDGVMTARGFRPTELNPRFGAALHLLGSDLELPLMLLNLAIVEGEPVDWRPRELERLLLDNADKHRRGVGSAMVERKVDQTFEEQLVYESTGTWRMARDDEEHEAVARLGPSGSGSYLTVALVSEHVPVGPSVAPRLAAALAWADAHWDLDIGELEPARDVRAGTAVTPTSNATSS